MKMLQSGYVIVSIFALVLLGQYIAENLGTSHYEKEGNMYPYDFFHQVLPDFHNYQWVINILPLLVILYAIIQIKGWNVLRATLLMLIVVMGIRAFCIMGTILPKHPDCVPIKNPFLNMLNGGGCYDKIFSGHTAFFTLLTLNLMKYKYLSTTMFWILNAVNIGTLALTRAHYTVDNILGFIIAYLVFDGEYRLFGGVKW